MKVNYKDLYSMLRDEYLADPRKAAKVATPVIETCMVAPKA